MPTSRCRSRFSTPASASATDVTPLQRPADVETLVTAAYLLPARHRRLSPALIALLQSAPGEQSVTLLLTTTPAERMVPADVERLERLRLAIAAFADAAIEAVLSQPTAVNDRCVVVLTLSAHHAALSDGAGGRLAPTAGVQFPMNLRALAGGDPASALRPVDRAPGTCPHPAPLIVAGPKRLVADFREVGWLPAPRAPWSGVLVPGATVRRRRPGSARGRRRGSGRHRWPRRRAHRDGAGQRRIDHTRPRWQPRRARAGWE